MMEICQQELITKETPEQDTEKEVQNVDLIDVKKVNGGKKKVVRKQRSLNWNDGERALLLATIKPKVESVENRSVEAKNVKSKRLAWMEITKQFNSQNYRHRSLEQIQVQWRSMKNSAKRGCQTKRLENDNHETLQNQWINEISDKLKKVPSNIERGRGNFKKNLTDSDDDTPLSALPITTVTRNSSSKPSSSILHSPSLSAADQQRSQNSRNRFSKKPNPKLKLKSSKLKNKTTTTSAKVKATSLQKRITFVDAEKVAAESFNRPHQSLSPTSPLFDMPDIQNVIDEKYKKKVFDLIKQSRQAEMEFARREHEQRLRHEELKWESRRREEELKSKHLREEHEIRMQQYLKEHEARIATFLLPTKRILNNTGGETINLEVQEELTT